MREPLRPDDEDLIEKLLAIPPEDREAVVAQIARDWTRKKDGRLWQTVTEWLIGSIRMEKTPSIELAFNLGRARERLEWVAHRAPVTGATPEGLALQRQNAWRGLLERNEARDGDNAWRHDEAEGWRTIARRVASGIPKYGSKRRIHDVINDELERSGFERMAPSTIRNAISGVKRPKK